MQCARTTGAMISTNSLLWASIEDAISECSKTDGRIVMCSSTIVQVHSQQADMVPNRGRNSGDQEENRCGEEEEDPDPGTLRSESIQGCKDAIHITSESLLPKP